MVLFIILGVIVLATFIILGVLFFMLNKEGAMQEEKAVPVKNPDQLNAGLSSQVFEQNGSKVIEHGSEVIPVFTPKVTLPTQPQETGLEDEKYKKRAQHLEDELLEISKKAAGQSDEARQLIEKLTKENESLKSQQAELEKAQQGLDGFQEEASRLKIENLKLESQLEATSAKVKFLEDEMAAFKIHAGEEISQANATISELTREKEGLLSAPKPVIDDSIARELGALKIEQASLKQQFDDLQKEKQSLEYELIKARAQSSGLERVSFNYKNQLEDFFKKINAVQVSNEQLSQAKNRLENVVSQVKTENEELSRKDQLARFELEKNRLRLVNLERECEELKVRLSKKDSEA